MLTITTYPTDYPITLAEAKHHIGGVPDDATNDTYINGLIAAVCEYVGNEVQRVLGVTSFRFHVKPASRVLFPAFPIDPTSVTVQFLDASGTLQPFSDDNYQVVDYMDPQAIEFATLPDTETLVIDFDAGSTAITTHPVLKSACLMLVKLWYDQREPITQDNRIPRPVDFSFQSIMRNFRRQHVM